MYPLYLPRREVPASPTFSDFPAKNYAGLNNDPAPSCDMQEKATINMAREDGCTRMNRTGPESRREEFSPAHAGIIVSR
jgi:hypothetical protein